MNNEYIITDIDKFIDATRVLVYGLLGNKEAHVDSDINMDYQQLSDLEKTEIDSCLSLQECKIIAQDFLHIKRYKKKREQTIISDKQYMLLIEAINSRLVSNMLSKMVNNNLLESAFDEEANDFIFWVKDEDDNTKK